MPLKEFTLITNTANLLWSHPTWDLMLVFTLFAMGFFYGMFAGKKKIASTILLTYVALAVSAALPTAWLKQFSGIGQDVVVKMGVFLTLFLVLMLVLGAKRGRGFMRSGPLWHVFLLSITQAGLLIHAVLSFLSPEQIKNLAPLTKTFFANPNLHLWWLLGPLVVLFFTRRIGGGVREE